MTEACDTTVNAFLEEMQIEADHPMTFMDRAALRSKLRRLTHFMRFVDLMTVIHIIQSTRRPDDGNLVSHSVV